MVKLKTKPDLRFAEFDGDWERQELGGIANIVRGASPRPIKNLKWFDDNSDIGWLRISDVTEQSGRIYHLEQRLSKMGQEKTRVLTEPHLLLSIAATVGKPVINYVKTGVHDGFLIFQDPLFDREFMFQWLEMFRPKWQEYGQPGSQVNLNSDLVKSKGIVLPSEQEQTKIGELFYTLDTLITLHQRKYDKTISIKKAMLEKMFPREGESKPEIRFAGFTEDWEYRKLYEISDKVREKNTNRFYTETLTNSAEFGVIAQSDYFDKKISNEENINNYYIVKNDDFVYNPRISSFAPVGPIRRNRLNRTGIMSPLYYVFRSKGIDLTYLEYFFSGSGWHRFMKLNGDSGARSDRFSIKDSMFKEMPIPYPLHAEQKKIGQFFSALDTLLALHQRELTKLKNIKKALLEKMFV